ncbi:MAG: transketolase [Solirubrobacterales bacterium]|jgi:transketolase|nr:transketolase [Solirubrobacterales bacterium]
MPEGLGLLIRRGVIEQSRRANVGHIGSGLSIADIVAAFFEGDVSLDPADPDRDRVILSKGHAALALYAALNQVGRISDEQLATFCGDGTPFAVHPEPAVEGIDFGTGSLGHGLSLGAGAALGARWQGSSRRTYVLMSDAECNEGSVWEAAQFAGHHKLGSLTAIVDLNGQQALGYTEDVLNLAEMRSAWEAFGWDVHEVDGHDTAGIVDLFAELPGVEKPSLILARTTFGKGVSFMESKIEWHYWPLSDENYTQAMSDLAEVAG